MNSTNKAGIIERVLKFNPNINAVHAGGHTLLFLAQAMEVNIKRNFHITPTNGKNEY